jgi:hypothetical protein
MQKRIKAGEVCNIVSSRGKRVKERYIKGQKQFKNLFYYYLHVTSI